VTNPLRQQYTWDPNDYGPTDVCLRCFAPISGQDDYAFCTRCGKISTVFDVPEQVQGHCHYHTVEKAVGHCALCTKPICEECVEYTTKPFLPPASQHHCRHCVQRATSIERQFFERIASARVCAKHEEVSAAYMCKKCGLPLCPPCAYFRKKGLLRPRLGDGPYCLICFRQTFFGSNRKRWLSGTQV